MKWLLHIKLQLLDNLSSLYLTILNVVQDDTSEQGNFPTFKMFRHPTWAVGTVTIVGAHPDVSPCRIHT